jgi:hypothetical protein
MKKYIQPAILFINFNNEAIMLGTSDMEGHGGPMANTGAFKQEDEQNIPSAKSIWE